MGATNKTALLQQVEQLADDIRQKRQGMEILCMRLVSEKEWHEYIFPKFDAIRETLNDIVSYVFLKDLEQQADCTEKNKKNRL